MNSALDAERRSELTGRFLGGGQGAWSILVLSTIVLLTSPVHAQSGRDLASPFRAPSAERPDAEPRRPSHADEEEDEDEEDEERSGVAVHLGSPSDAVIPPPPGTAYGAPVAAAPSGLRLPSTISTRLRALEGDLQALALRGSGYIVDGVVQLLSSGVSIAVGVLFATSGSSGDAFSGYLFTMGGVGVARGLLTLLVPVTPSESAVAYAHPIPLTSYREARARLHAREGELEGLATAGMVGRVIDGSLGVGVGLAMIPIFAAVGEFDTEQPLNYVMLLLAGVSTITGVITLFSTSDPERRWNGYVELRDRLQVTAAGSADDRWLDEHADDEPELVDEMVLMSDRGPTLDVSVGLGGGSMRLTF